MTRQMAWSMSGRLHSAENIRKRSTKDEREFSLLLEANGSEMLKKLAVQVRTRWQRLLRMAPSSQRWVLARARMSPQPCWPSRREPRSSCVVGSSPVRMLILFMQGLFQDGLGPALHGEPLWRDLGFLG